VVFVLGAMVEPALEAAENLSKNGGLEIEVWDARFCRPLDTGALANAARRHAWLGTVEEHSLNGGFGSAVAETLADLKLPIRLLRLGVPDQWILHMSNREEQLEQCGLSVNQLEESWRQAAQEAVTSIETITP
jgi:1-deoxy-D-xylulose-5-phosphate synthase